MIGTSSWLKFLSFVLFMLVMMVQCSATNALPEQAARQLRGREDAVKTGFEEDALVEMECPSKATTMERDIAIGAHGDFKSMQPRDFESIERAVMTAANGVYDQSCDPYFRSITDVSFEAVEDGHRDLQLTLNMTFIIRAVGECRKCGDGNGLFNDAARRLQDPTLVTEVQHRLQETDVCFCDETAAKNVHMPTMKEFRYGLEKELRNLKVPMDFDPWSVVEIREGKK